MASGSDPLLGSIEMWSGTFVPQGWAACDGSSLQISEYSNLYSLIGTTYGGDGITTFKLPDLRGRTPIGYGQGPGLPNYVISQTGGEVSHTLATAELPSHNHAFSCNENTTTLLNTPTNNFPAKSSAGESNYAASSNENKSMGPNILKFVGSSQPHNNLQPFLAVYFIIAVEGVFPSRN
jgi:microcystin-dependent protein